MNTTNQQQDHLKSAVSVKEMATMCGLSRQRFAQLVKAGVFPAPLYDVSTHRPFYTEDMQKVCLEVRRRNCGYNGKVVIFYSRCSITITTPPKPEKPPKGELPPEILDGVKALGLSTVTAAQVAEAMKVLYPSGTAGAEPTEVIRTVFIHLRRKNGAVNVGSK